MIQHFRLRQNSIVNASGNFKFFFTFTHNYFNFHNNFIQDLVDHQHDILAYSYVFATII